MGCRAREGAGEPHRAGARAGPRTRAGARLFDERVDPSLPPAPRVTAMSTPSVVLFDIDGTLLTTGGAGARAWAYAFDSLFGTPADITKFSEVGMTDPMVARRTFRGALGRDPDEGEFASLIMGYVMR